MAWIVITFVILAAIAKALQDTVSFHYDTSIFKKYSRRFFDSEISWSNKYKEDLVDGKVVPKFWGSTTIFVWTTDGFHLFQMFFLLFIFGAIVTYDQIIPLKENLKILSILLDYCLLRLIFGLTFELFYSKIFIRK